MNMLEIDGSIGEGGGQVLRTSLALSSILGVPIRIYNIRAKRSKPGLRPQHLNSVKAVAMLSGAEVEGLRIGSTELVFKPRRLRGGSFKIDIGTAGSISLIIQAVAPIAAFAPQPVRIWIRGGTDVPMSPTIDYMRVVFSRILRLLGYKLSIGVVQRGHYPRGGGIVVFEVSEPPGKLGSVVIEEPGDVEVVEGISHAWKLPRHVAERQANAAKLMISSKIGVVPRIEIEWEPESSRKALGPGSGITLWALTKNSILGSDALGARGKRAEKVGEEAAVKLLEDLKTRAALDRHMSDMIIPYLALASGTSIISGARLTLHAYTNIMVTKMFLEKIEISVEGDRDKPFKLRVRSPGLSI